MSSPFLEKIMKEYKYKKSIFLRKVTLTSLFAGFVGVICTTYAIQGTHLPRLLSILIAFVMFYQVLNAFVAVANPETITLSDDAISFSAYGKTHEYKLDDIKEFRVKEFPGSGKMYIRINGGNLFKGRYWLDTFYTHEGDELFKEILELEDKLHPDSLKAHARRTSNLNKKKK